MAGSRARCPVDQKSPRGADSSGNRRPRRLTPGVRSSRLAIFL